MANLYYREDLQAEAFEPGATVEIAGDEGRHAVRVSRLRIGEQTLVGNGAGAIARGAVTAADRDRFAVRIESVERRAEPEQRLVLVQALAKGDRDERAIEQATEFGVDAIVPWQAARSVSRWDGAGGGGGAARSGSAEKAQKGVARWARIAREASKQSLRARIPELRQPTATKQLCEEATRADREVIVLHPAGAGALSDWVSEHLAPATREVLLVVGPEGGISDEELEQFGWAGSRILRLGDTVLRTSSAGPAALAVLNVALGRW